MKVQRSIDTMTLRIEKRGVMHRFTPLLSILVIDLNRIKKVEGYLSIM